QPDERHERHPVADQGDRRTAPEQREVPLPEELEVAPHGRILRSGAARSRQDSSDRMELPTVLIGIRGMQRRSLTAVLAAILTLIGCASPVSPPTSVGPSGVTASSSPTPGSTRVVHASYTPIVTGTPIALTELSGRIVADDFEDLFVMN